MKADRIVGTALALVLAPLAIAGGVVLGIAFVVLSLLTGRRQVWRRKNR